jgi:hypothetical protein
MLVQDTLSGYLHEVPDQLYGGYFGELPEYAEAPVVYDGLGGFGYPVGLPFLPAIAAALPSIAGLASKALPAVSGLLGKLPGVGGLVQGLIGGGVPGMPPLPIPPLPGLPALPGFPPLPGAMPFRPPWPAGWIHPPLPYTGLGPRRLYMRCAVWPGPHGLVPGHAAAMPGAPAIAAASPSAAAVVSPAGAAVAFPRRRRFRRVR